MKMPPPYLSVNFCVQELSFPGSGTWISQWEKVQCSIGFHWKALTAENGPIRMIPGQAKIDRSSWDMLGPQPSTAFSSLFLRQNRPWLYGQKRASGEGTSISASTDCVSFWDAEKLPLASSDPVSILWGGGIRDSFPSQRELPWRGSQRIPN
jgi:hypothetical protein